VETEIKGRVNSCFVAQANAWRQRRRFEVAARHDQEGAPQIGPEHWNIGTIIGHMQTRLRGLIEG